MRGLGERGAGMGVTGIGSTGIGSAGVTGTMLVPAFREAGTIAGTLAALDRLCRTELASVRWDILVVDDGSDDDTSAVAAAAAAACRTPVRVIRHRQNEGLGGALRNGLAASTGDVVLTVDCDLSYGPEDLVRLVEQWLATRAHIVLASPYMPGGATAEVPRALEVRSRAANAFLSRMALGEVTTLTAMVRAYDGPFVRALTLKAAGPDINVEIIYKAQVLRARIDEVPATLDWSGRGHRAGRSSLLSEGSRWNTAKDLVMGYLWRPFVFPAIVAVACALVAVAVISAGRFSWQAVAVTTAVLAVQLAFASLSSLQAKRYFEELYTVGASLRAALPTQLGAANIAVAYEDGAAPDVAA